MELLKDINQWVQKGYEITYYIVNQVENGYLEEVLGNQIANFTYTFTIHHMEEELFSLSVDTLEDGYNESLKFLIKNIDNK